MDVLVKQAQPFFITIIFHTRALSLTHSDVSAGMQLTTCQSSPDCLSMHIWCRPFKKEACCSPQTSDLKKNALTLIFLITYLQKRFQHHSTLMD